MSMLGSVSAEEIVGPGEGPNPGSFRSHAILLRIAHMERGGQIQLIGTSEVEEHARQGLAARASLALLVGTEAPVDEEVTETGIEPFEARNTSRSVISPLPMRAWFDTMKHEPNWGRTLLSTSTTCGFSTGCPASSITVRPFRTTTRVPP